MGKIWLRIRALGGGRRRGASGGGAPARRSGDANGLAVRLFGAPLGGRSAHGFPIAPAPPRPRAPMPPPPG
jgi:hypothetical protein